jgi:hypothetical protein
MYLVICVCVFFHKKEKMYRHCHLSLCENKKKNVHFWRMMQLEILNHHCFVCIKKEEKKIRKKINTKTTRERIEYTQTELFQIFYLFCSKKKN